MSTEQTTLSGNPWVQMNFELIMQNNKAGIEMWFG